MKTVSQQAAELLAWIEHRAQPREGGVLLPKSSCEQFRQAIGRMWRDHWTEEMTTDEKDGMEQLREIFDWDHSDYAIWTLSDVASHLFCPCLKGDWGWNPNVFGSVRVALRLIAKNVEAAPVINAEPEGAKLEGADDDDGYVMAVTIWKGRFTKYEDFRKWLANHPEIPTKPKGKQRLLVHAAKCLEALAKQDKSAFDRLDDTERPEVVPDTVDDATYLGNVESLYRDVFASKKPQK